MRCATLILLVLAGGPQPTAAQEQQTEMEEAAAHIEVGTRVRVSTRTADENIGLVERVTADALLVRLDDASLLVTVPFVELESLEMSQGNRSRGAGAWSKAKWGAFFGGVPGAISLGLQHDQVGENGSSVGKAMALGAWSGGLFGGLIGAAIGAAHPGEKWEKVTPVFRLHPAESGGGYSFAASIEF